MLNKTFSGKKSAASTTTTSATKREIGIWKNRKVLNEIAGEQKEIRDLENIKEAYELAEDDFKEVKRAKRVKKIDDFDKLSKSLENINEKINQSLTDFKKLTGKTYKAERKTAEVIKNLNKKGVDTTSLQVAENTILVEHDKAVKELKKLNIETKDIIDDFNNWKNHIMHNPAPGGIPYPVPSTDVVFNGILTKLDFSSATLDAIIKAENKAYKDLLGAVAILRGK